MKFLVTTLFSIVFLFASVDINNASEKEFTSLNGVGAKKASAIVKYRDSIKCFKSIDELTAVKGIGTAIVSKNRNELKLGVCKK